MLNRLNVTKVTSTSPLTVTHDADDYDDTTTDLRITTLRDITDLAETTAITHRDTTFTTLSKDTDDQDEDDHSQVNETYTYITSQETNATQNLAYEQNQTSMPNCTSSYDVECHLNRVM